MNHSSTSEWLKPVTERGQRTRQKLLVAAEKVFGRRGYEEASISDITRGAGVAQGTFYVYFPDKRAIFIETVDGLGARMRRTLSKAVKGLTDRLEVEREGLKAFLAFTHKHRGLYRIVRQAEFVDPATFHRYYSTVARAYARALKQAMDRGQVRRLNPEALAYCLMGMGDFLGMRFVLWEERPATGVALQTALSLLEEGMFEKGGSAARGRKREPKGERR